MLHRLTGVFWRLLTIDTPLLLYLGECCSHSVHLLLYYDTVYTIFQYFNIPILRFTREGRVTRVLLIVLRPALCRHRRLLCYKEVSTLLGVPRGVAKTMSGIYPLDHPTLSRGLRTQHRKTFLPFTTLPFARVFFCHTSAVYISPSAPSAGSHGRYQPAPGSRPNYPPPHACRRP